MLFPNLRVIAALFSSGTKVLFRSLRNSGNSSQIESSHTITTQSQAEAVWLWSSQQYNCSDCCGIDKMRIWIQGCVFNSLGPLPTQQLFKCNSHYLFVSLIYYYINYTTFMVY